MSQYDPHQKSAMGNSISQHSDTASLKQATVMEILIRVEQLFDVAKSNEARLGNIESRISGPSSGMAAESNPQSVSPPASHVLFLASRIEQELKNHLERMASTITNLENII